MKVRLTVANDVESAEVRRWVSAIETSLNNDAELGKLLNETNVRGFALSVTFVPDQPQPAQQPKPVPDVPQPAPEPKPQLKEAPHEQPARHQPTPTRSSRR
jgi:hypothetical protein